MDESSLTILLMTAMSIGFVHTLIGVDHALPFVALSRARGWKLPKTLGVTALCGLGHVLSSVILGCVGLGLGVAIERLEWIEGFRGELTAYLMIGFGLAYAAASTINCATVPTVIITAMPMEPSTSTRILTITTTSTCIATQRARPRA